MRAEPDGEQSCEQREEKGGRQRGSSLLFKDGQHALKQLAQHGKIQQGKAEGPEQYKGSVGYMPDRREACHCQGVTGHGENAEGENGE